MKYKKISIILCTLFIVSLVISGCGNSDTAKPPDATQAEAETEEADNEAAAAEEGSGETDAEDINAENSETENHGSEDDNEKQQDETAKEEEPEAEGYHFTPYVYSEKLSEKYDENWWQSFYNMVDAIRAGEDTFECYDEQTYKECTDEIKLGELYPVACVYVTNKSNDGTTPYKNGVGRLYYTIPKEEFREKREAFEAEVDRMLSEAVKTDFTDFEKCIGLFSYISRNFTYDDEGITTQHVGATYRTLMEKSGICCELASAYAYLLLQCGVDAIEVQSNDDIYHAWTYVILNGEGYYADVTWSLREKGESLNLQYFLETEQERTEDGFDLSTIDIPLFMDEFGRFDGSKYKCPATDKTYSRLRHSECEGVNRKTKVLRYYDYLEGKSKEFHYE
ncbi:MAG: hypothetical protein IK078_07325 [Lachnospiraceae bacterium]|nr:hypothetical protein [Lachnospiraceae bacterium]